MKLFFNTNLYLMIILIMALSSCETNEITKLKFDKAEITMLVGQSDSLTATISYSGELSQFPHEWKIADPTIFSIKEKISNEKAEGASFEKSVVIKALKSGNTTLSITIGGKTLSCDVKVSQKTYNFNQAYAANWGDFYDTETNNYDMYLLENTLSLNAEGKVQGNGTMIYLEFYVPLTQNTLAPAEFILSDEGDNNTFYPGGVIENEGETLVVGSRLITIDGKTATISIIKDGEFSIVRNGENFVVAGEFILGDDEVIQFSYVGIINETDEREEPVEINPSLTKGLLIYFGDAYDSKTSNNFMAYLGSESINFEDSVLTGELLQLEFNTALNVQDLIPNGSYNMMAELTYKELVPYSLVFGYTTKEGNKYGSWYYGETDKKLKTGSITSVKLGDTYTIGYELYDRFGSKVWGTFNGPLEYIDATKSASSAPAYIKGNKKKAAPAKKMFNASKMMLKKKPLRY